MPVTCWCRKPESLVSLGFTVSELLPFDFSRVLALTRGSMCPLCSGEVESLSAGEHEVVFTTGFVPGGSDKEERMQSSIGNNRGSTEGKDG